MDSQVDIVIIGSGMAGASLAAAIGDRASILIVEAEDRPGYHATGRSAAFWTESYGGPAVQPLTTASGPMLRGLGVLTERKALTIARRGNENALSEFERAFGALGIELHHIGRDALESFVPGLRSEWTQGILEPSTCDIDVAGLHQHYLAGARRAGARMRYRAALQAARKTPDGWTLQLADATTIRCRVVVNAAGAWADAVAKMSGVSPLGIQPFRRTIAQVATVRPAPAELPLVLDVAGTFYFKPENGRIWLSPHDETRSLPCDAAPEEIDVASAIDRFEHVVDWGVERVEHRWAGLRSFAPDRLPVYGFDPEVQGFFWFAGQGGFGIQTAPAAADLGARLLLGENGGQVDPTAYRPSRFR